jgi:hypothetical protein
MPTVQTVAGTVPTTDETAGRDIVVQVVPISQLREACRSGEGRIVIDALDVDRIAPTELACAVHWHRRLQLNGRLVLAVSRGAARSLAQSGLHTLLPHRFSLESAVDAARTDVRRPAAPYA